MKRIKAACLEQTIHFQRKDGISATIFRKKTNLPPLPVPPLKGKESQPKGAGEIPPAAGVPDLSVQNASPCRGCFEEKIV